MQGRQQVTRELKPTREVYHAVYQGITIEVSRRWTEQPHPLRGDIWCFYLYLLVEQFPERYHADLCRPASQTSYGSPFQPYAECLEDLNWHGEMTFYSRDTAPEGPFRAIKAGCDYLDLWGEGPVYTASGVMRDAKRCVESLWEKFPGLHPAEALWEDHKAPFRAAMKAKEAMKL